MMPATTLPRILRTARLLSVAVALVLGPRLPAEEAVQEKAADSNPASAEAAPENGSPDKAAPEKAAPEKAAPEKAAPEKRPAEKQTKAAGPKSRQHVVVVVGAPGAEEYGQAFTSWAGRWQAAADEAGAACVRLGDVENNPNESQDAATDESPTTDHDCLRQHLLKLAESPPETVWLVLIGHGTFDGKAAKFNLRGPDVTAAELAEWLAPLEAPLAVINCASASGPFVNALSREGRVVITATKSGFEYNYARFGDYLSSAIVDPEADLNKDQQTSLLEAYLAAAAKTQEFYEQEARLATEHALLDDNGDQLGTPADFFQGYRAVKAAKDGAAPDGGRANQFVLLRRGREADMPVEVRRRRDELELAVERLRRRKGQFSPEEYYAQLEPLLIEMARLYESLETPGDDAPR